jgi:hypothetical protein
MPLPPLRASSYLHSPLSREANAAGRVATRGPWQLLTTGCGLQNDQGIGKYFPEARQNATVELASATGRTV